MSDGDFVIFGLALLLGIGIIAIVFAPAWLWEWVLALMAWRNRSSKEQLRDEIAHNLIRALAPLDLPKEPQMMASESVSSQGERRG